MIMMRHFGLYVRDLETMETFYRDSFQMKSLVSGLPLSGELIEDLLEASGGEVKISKLITEYGVLKKDGDMLELVQVTSFGDKRGSQKAGTTKASDPEVEGTFFERSIYAAGTAHLAFGVDDVEETVKKACALGGRLRTRIHSMENGRKCAFLTDPEGNWIELIG